MFRQRGKIFSPAVAVALALLLSLSALGHPASHIMAGPGSNGDAHSGTSISGPEESGHSHHDGWPDGERHSGTSHGHHTNDHLHEIPLPSAQIAYAAVFQGGPAYVCRNETPSEGPPFRIERPPRS